MSLKSIAKDDFSRFVSDTDEFAERVLYTRYADSSQISTSAIFEQIDMYDKQDDDRIIGDSIFAYISLDFTPEVYDKILYESKEWIVKSFRKMEVGYKIELTKEDRKTHKHTQGRFR